MGFGRSVAVAVLLLAARAAAGGGFLEGAPVERRIEISGVAAIDIDAAHFTVEVLGAPELDTVSVVSRMSTRFHRFHDGHVAVERSDGGASISLRYDGRPLSKAAVAWGPLLVLQVPERTALAVTTTAGDVRIHDVAAPNVTITTTAGDLYLSDVTATVDITARAGFIVLERVHGSKRINADSGSIEVSDSRGPLFTDTGGEQRLRRIDGDVSVASGGGLTLTDHRGALTVRGRTSRASRWTRRPSDPSGARRASAGVFLAERRDSPQHVRVGHARPSRGSGREA